MREPDARLGRMRGDIHGIVWPPVFSPQLAPLAALIQQLERSQWLAPGEIAQGQGLQLARLAKYFSRHSDSFRARLDVAGLSPSHLADIGQLKALAPLTRKDVQSNDPPLRIATVPKSHAPTASISTSGSTGEPVVVWRTAINQLYWLALTMRYNLWAEPDFDGRVCAIRALQKRFGETKGWGEPMDLFFQTGPGFTIDIEDDIRDQIELIQSFAPTTLIVYPSNLAAILDELAKSGSSLPSLRRVRTIGETLTPELRARAGDMLDARVFDCYSSQELGYIAIQCPDSSLYHIMSEGLIVELVDVNGDPVREGEPGRILVTDLQNYAMPMIRYDVGDYAIAGPPCSCGRGLPTIARILGRERNLVRKPDGSRHWPLTGYAGFREVAPVEQYQIRQHAIDKVEMRLVVTRALSREEEAKMRSLLQKALRYPFEVEITYFEGRLPTGPNGKFEEFVSLF